MRGWTKERKIKGVTPGRRRMNAVVIPVMALIAAKLTISAYPFGVGVVDTIGVLACTMGATYVGSWHLASSGRRLRTGYLMTLMLIASYVAMAAYTSMPRWPQTWGTQGAVAASVLFAGIAMILAAATSVMGMRPMAQVEQEKENGL